MFALLTGGLLALAYFQVQSFNQLEKQLTSINPPTPIPSNTTPPIATKSSTIQANLNSLTERLDRLEGLPTPTAPPANINARTSNPAPFQKQVLTFGSATTTKQAWTPTGLEMTINSADYPNSVMAHFEAGLNCSGCLAWARLTNKTTGAVINLSEVSHDTNTVTWKRSSGFKLHPGNHNYVVELRSSSGEAVYLSSSRLVLEKP